MDKYPAAYLTTLLLLSCNVRAETVQEYIAKVSGNPCPKTHEADKAFVRKVGKLVNRLDPEDCGWLATCASSLAVLLTQSANPVAVKFAIEQLISCGWRETLVAMSDRLRPALISNLPPVAVPMTKADMGAIRRLNSQSL